MRVRFGTGGVTRGERGMHAARQCSLPTAAAEPPRTAYVATRTLQPPTAAACQPAPTSAPVQRISSMTKRRSRSLNPEQQARWAEGVVSALRSNGL